MLAAVESVAMVMAEEQLGQVACWMKAHSDHYCMQKYARGIGLSFSTVGQEGVVQQSHCTRHHVQYDRVAVTQPATVFCYEFSTTCFCVKLRWFVEEHVCSKPGKVCT